MSAAVTFVALVAATSNLSLGQAINAFVYRVSLPVLAAIVVVSFLLLCTVGEGTNTRLWQDISKALSIASFAAVILSACAVGGAAAFVLF